MDDSHLFPPDTCPDLRELSTLFAAPVQWVGGTPADVVEAAARMVLCRYAEGRDENRHAPQPTLALPS